MKETEGSSVIGLQDVGKVLRIRTSGTDDSGLDTLVARNPPGVSGNVVLLKRVGEDKIISASGEINVIDKGSNNPHTHKGPWLVHYRENPLSTRNYFGLYDGMLRNSGL